MSWQGLRKQTSLRGVGSSPRVDSFEFFGNTFKKVSPGFFGGEDSNLFSRIGLEVLDTTCDRLVS